MSKITNNGYGLAHWAQDAL